jgi:hypothetical protein
MKQSALDTAARTYPLLPHNRARRKSTTENRKIEHVRGCADNIRVGHAIAQWVSCKGPTKATRTRPKVINLPNQRRYAVR